MKRMVKVVSVFVAVCLVMSGCIYRHDSVVINSDCSGSYTCTVGFDKAFIESMTDSYTPEDGEELEEFVVDGVTYVGTADTETFDSAEDFNAKVAELYEDDETSMTMSMTADGIVLDIVMVPASFDENQDLSEDTPGIDEMLASAVIEMDYTFPEGYTVVQTSGESYGIAILGNSVVFDVLEAAELYQSYTDAIKISFLASEDGSSVSSIDFKDVAEDSPYKEAIDWAVDSGITYGITSTEFGTYKQCTKAQILTFIYRFEGQPTFEGYLADSLYPYYNAIEWAISEGLTDGVDTNEPCTRLQALKYMYARYGYDVGTSKAAKFTDVSGCSDAELKAISWGLTEGITNGVYESSFAPNSTCTRAQIITFLYRELSL